MRLPRKFSINSHSDFARVKKTGRSKAGQFLIVSTLEDLALPSLRVGFITSKRSSRKAHDRNLVRRRFRSLVQSYAPQFAETRRYLVVIALRGADRATFAELEGDWLRQARRLKLFPQTETNP